MSDLRRDPSTDLRRAALELFARNGYQATSLQDVAERVGYTKANVLYHFGSKQALFDAAVAPVVDGFEELSHEFASGGDDAWADWAERMVDFLLEHEHAVSIFINQVSTLRDQPLVARVNEVIFALDSSSTSPDADPLVVMRRHIAIAGAAYCIAQRSHGGFDMPERGESDEEFRHLIRAAVRDVVADATVREPEGRR